MRYKEEWKDIDGFEGYYQISNKGRIKSFKVNKKGIILKLTNSKKDYFAFVLIANGKRKSTRIHRLVATHFLPNPNSLPIVNHIDGNKQNNRVENLEWCTISHNVIDAVSRNPQQLNGMMFHNKHKKAKRVTQIDKTTMIPLITSCNATVAGNSVGVCPRNILQCCNGQRKTAGGYIWKYESEVIWK